MSNDSDFIPEINNELRRNIIILPKEIQEASGINIYGRNIKSLIFTTDVAIIRNNNADAVLSVYPFTPQPAITQALIQSSDIPVFCGVGGGLTAGERVLEIARDAEFQGAGAIVVNQPTSNELIAQLKQNVHIPVVLTVCNIEQDFKERIKAGVDIFNVSGAGKTPDIIKRIRKIAPKVPIIATGGIDAGQILQTIKAGANAITFSPPSSSDLMKQIMENYRLGINDLPF